MKHSFIDEHSGIESPIHRMGPRCKIICLLALIITIVCTPPNKFIIFALYAVFAFALIFLSRLPLSFILKKSLMVIPFVFFISFTIPFFKEGEVVLSFQIFALTVHVTREGLVIAWNILAKSYLCGLFTILVFSTTKFNSLLKALERLKVPVLIVMIISFMYRYVFIITDELMKMNQARLSRTVGGSNWFHTKVLANMLGSLFIRTYERGENVYLAMCSRGFDGNIKTIYDECDRDK